MEEQECGAPHSCSHEAELVRRFVFDPLPRQRSMLVANERSRRQLDPVSADRTKR